MGTNASPTFFDEDYEDEDEDLFSDFLTEDDSNAEEDQSPVMRKREQVRKPIGEETLEGGEDIRSRWVSAAKSTCGVQRKVKYTHVRLALRKAFPSDAKGHLYKRIFEVGLDNCHVCVRGSNACYRGDDSQFLMVEDLNVMRNYGLEDKNTARGGHEDEDVGVDVLYRYANANEEHLNCAAGPGHTNQMFDVKPLMYSFLCVEQTEGKIR